MSVMMEDVYPSRVGDRPRLLDRADPVVYRRGAWPGPLTPAQLDFYEESGFVVIESLFQPEEIARLNAELRELAGSTNVHRLAETITELNSRETARFFVSTR